MSVYIDDSLSWSEWKDEIEARGLRRAGDLPYPENIQAWDAHRAWFHDECVAGRPPDKLEDAEERRQEAIEQLRTNIATLGRVPSYHAYNRARRSGEITGLSSHGICCRLRTDLWKEALAIAGFERQTTTWEQNRALQLDRGDSMPGDWQPPGYAVKLRLPIGKRIA